MKMHVRFAWVVLNNKENLDRIVKPASVRRGIMMFLKKLIVYPVMILLHIVLNALKFPMKISKQDIALSVGEI